MKNISPNPSQRTGIILGIVLVVIVVIALFIFAGRTNDNTTNTNNTLNTASSVTNTSVNISGNATNNSSNSTTNTSTTGSTKTITLTAEDFSYSLDTIQANKGDTVKITLTSASGTHNFTIDELNVKSTNVTEGNSTTIGFVATTAGEFTYYCSVDSHRDLGLRGTLIVK